MRVLIRGAGDLASGIALRLHRAGLDVVMTDLEKPTAIRRTVCFSQALVLGAATVEDVTARAAASAAQAEEILAAGEIPVLADPACTCREALRPDALVDAILAKRNLGMRIGDAPVVIGVGPGFTAGEDCHAVVETMRGHTLGRVIYRGSAIPNTNIPGQQFSDDWTFTGSLVSEYRQIGNAVPVGLARAIGQMLIAVANDEAEIKVKRIRGTGVHDRIMAAIRLGGSN